MKWLDARPAGVLAWLWHGTAGARPRRLPPLSGAVSPATIGTPGTHCGAGCAPAAPPTLVAPTGGKARRVPGSSVAQGGASGSRYAPLLPSAALRCPVVRAACDGEPARCGAHLDQVPPPTSSSSQPEATAATSRAALFFFALSDRLLLPPPPSVSASLPEPKSPCAPSPAIQLLRIPAPCRRASASSHSTRRATPPNPAIARQNGWPGTSSAAF